MCIRDRCQAYWRTWKTVITSTVLSLLLMFSYEAILKFVMTETRYRDAILGTEIMWFSRNFACVEENLSWGLCAYNASRLQVSMPAVDWRQWWSPYGPNRWKHRSLFNDDYWQRKEIEWSLATERLVNHSFHSFLQKRPPETARVMIFLHSTMFRHRRRLF